MFSKFRHLGFVAALLLACGFSACGDQGTQVAIGDIVLTAINFDGTAGPGCSVGGPGPFPSYSTEIAISGTGFATVPGNAVVIRYTALGGARPFHGGTSEVAEEAGIVFSDTLICGNSPDATVCGTATVQATIEVILLSDVRDDSTAATAGPTFTATFAAPAITTVTA
ncbi:MAG: hypothetical protein ACYTG6_14680, partial [Planctomycetota bacterium]